MTELSMNSPPEIADLMTSQAAVLVPGHCHVNGSGAPKIGRGAAACLETSAPG